MEIPYFVLNEKINETFLEEDIRTEVEGGFMLRAT